MHRDLVGLLDVPCEETLVKIISYGVIDEALLSLWLTPGLVLEYNIIIPSSPDLKRWRLIEEWVAPSNFFSKLRLFLSLILLALPCSLLSPLFLNSFKLCQELCLIILKKRRGKSSFMASDRLSEDLGLSL